MIGGGKGRDSFMPLRAHRKAWRSCQCWVGFLCCWCCCFEKVIPKPDSGG